MPLARELTRLDNYAPMAFNAARIVVILVLAFIFSRLMNRLLLGLRGYVVQMMMKTGGGSDFEIEKRVRTVSGLFRKSIAILIWTIAGLMILKEFNLDVRPLIAGAGVIGVAVGFGAQNIIKDLLGGLFILMENQIRINDVATINGKSGVVEEINLRTTVLRDEDGTVHIFPNGVIQGLSNLTREYSFYVFSLSVSYDDDPDHAIQVLKEIADQLKTEDPYQSAILAPLEVMGLDKLADAGMVIKARYKTLPGKQWMVGREMNRRIKKRFEEAHVDMPFSEQRVYVVPELSPELRATIKELVIDAVKETATRTPQA